MTTEKVCFNVNEGDIIFVTWKGFSVKIIYNKSGQ